MGVDRLTQEINHFLLTIISKKACNKVALDSLAFLTYLPLPIEVGLQDGDFNVP